MKIYVDTNKTYNNDFKVVDVIDLYEYVNGEKGKIIGSKVICVLPSHQYERISVKIPKKKEDIIKFIDNDVNFMNLEATAYVYNGRVQVSLRAQEMMAKKG